jgi:hypothetical protein
MTAPGGVRSGFVLAMRAQVRQAEGGALREWLIVSRWGEGGRYLSLSRCLVHAVPGATAPIALTPRETMLATLLPVPRSERTPSFLFLRKLPPRIVLAGIFLPVDGYARLQGSDARMHLTAEGRYTRARGGGAWRMDGLRAPWPGEFLEDEPTPPGGMSVRRAAG